MFEQLKEKYNRFKEWQLQPHQVAPLVNEPHECATCGTHYEGNYCPRCGQSAKIGRYSFKKAFLLFLDVWGLGNRGMFRTIRDLILRPGYMIRDYLQGMQMAYFPPFKMFFLLVALSLVVETGLNVKMENRLESSQEQFARGMDNAFAEKDSMSVIVAENGVKTEGEPSIVDKGKAENTEGYSKSEDSVQDFLSHEVNDWMVKHISIVTIVFLLLFSGPLYLFFRKSPAYPDIRFSEFFVAMVYSMNMINIFSIVTDFLCLNVFLDFFYLFLIVIPIKQLSGFSYWRTLLHFLLALILFFLVVLLVIFIIVVVISNIW